MAESLAKQPRPRGPRLAIVTNAGGPAVLATDALLAQRRHSSPSCSADTLATLDGVLPPAWSHGNPVDVLGDADPGRYAQAPSSWSPPIPNSDGLLVILTPAGDDRSDRARPRTLKPYAQVAAKPLLASWMGGADVAGRREHPEPRRHPDLPLSGHGGADVHAHVALHRQSARCSTRRPMLAAEGERPGSAPTPAR